MEIYISHTSYILSTFFLIPLFPIVLNSTSPCITWLPSTSLHSLNTLPNSVPLFPHFGLILFHMAPEHRQREHEGNEEKERARERARGERRRTGGGGGAEKKDEEKNKKGRQKTGEGM